MKRIEPTTDIMFKLSDLKDLTTNFKIRFYTTNKLFYFEKTQSDVSHHIISSPPNFETEDFIKLNWSELVSIGAGVMNYTVYTYETDADFDDEIYNNSYSRTTDYYLDSGVIIDDNIDHNSLLTSLIDKSITSIIIPEGCETIGAYIFYTDRFLREIVLPSTLKGIQEYAFYGCMSLREFTLPNGLTYIGSYAFQGALTITDITIPNTVTTIGPGAFSDITYLSSLTLPNNNQYKTLSSNLCKNCRRLNEITIPSSITTIGHEAFANCRELEIATIQATTPPTLNGVPFSNNASNFIICVPSASVAAYRSASGWSDYSSIIKPITE